MKTTSARIIVILLAAVTHVIAQDSSLRPIELKDTVKWRTISGWRLSPKGKFVAWVEKTDDGSESTLHISSTTKGAHSRSFPGAELPTFVSGDKVAVTWKHPTEQAKRDAKKDKKPTPKKTLAIITLADGSVEELTEVGKFGVPKVGGSFIALLMEKDSDKTAPKTRPKKKAKKPNSRRKKGKKGTEKPQEPAEKKSTLGKGHLLILRDLNRNKATEYPGIVSFLFSRDGRALVLFTGNEGNVIWIDPRTGRSKTAIKAIGEVKSPKLDRSGKRLLFLAELKTNDKGTKKAYEIVVYQKGRTTHRFGTPGKEPIAMDWEVSPDRSPRFSRDGKRVLFGIRKQSAQLQKTKEDSDDSKVKTAKLDIWSWKDDYIQPRQLKRVGQEKKRSRLVIAHITNTGPKLVAMESERLRSVSLAFGDTGDFALGVDDGAYRRQASYDTNHPKDVWLIDVNTGERECILTQVRGRPRLSPSAHWVYWWDGARKTWMARSTAEGSTIDLGSGIDEALESPKHDSPSLPRPRIRSLSWTKNDEKVIIGAQHDIYVVPLSDPLQARSMTQRLGRDSRTRFSLIDRDPDEVTVKLSGSMLLSAFHADSRDSGIWRGDGTGTTGPEPLLRVRSRLGRPIFARESSVAALTVESFDSPPDIHITTRTFGKLRRVSDLASQLTPYKWGNSQLVKWTGKQGKPLEGILYLPADFDPAKKYPMLVNFYERNSDRLHSFQTPSPHRSSVRMSYYTSQGYVCFVPDVEYTIGSPGQSAVDCVVPGIESILKQGFVDPSRIGLQGHSWGGYQAAFLITKTNLFAGVIAGAPVANMTSAYGGIRWGSGMSRQFQYEKTQSRIGKTLWEARDRYIANSPLFFLNAVQTPVLILHNDKDGAVPWYQGIELFMGLRRLSKPVWLLNYNGQPHWVTTPENRLDYARRMKQFLDHYCNGKPAPSWMTRGVPAVKKGEDLGLQLESNDG